MRIERVRANVFDVRLQATELATMIAAARWAVEDAPGEMPEEARAALRQLLASYDQQTARVKA